MYLAIDIGGTNVRIGQFEQKSDNSFELFPVSSFPVQQNFEKGFSDLVDVLQQHTAGKKIDGIGICLPGIVDEEQTTLATNLRDWERKPIRKLLADKFKTRVLLTHDVAASAIGESLYGHGKGKETDKFVMMIWGTGVGGVFLSRKGKQVSTLSFEPGHHIIDQDGLDCNCGQQGCAETYIGGGALSTRFGSEFLKQVSDQDSFWNEVIDRTTQTVLNTFAFYPVKNIIFSGGLIVKRAFILPKIEATIRVTQKVADFAPTLSLAKLGEDSALYGCLGLFEIERIIL
jgi:glucokinase